jgi:hypothetical protein
LGPVDGQHLAADPGACAYLAKWAILPTADSQGQIAPMSHPRVKPTGDAVPPVAPDSIALLHRLGIRNTRRSPLVSFFVWLVLAAIGWGIVAIVISLI